jgi:hypothetical protein
MNSSPLFINVNVSVHSERDNSEVVSVVTTFPSDGEGPYGILSASSKPGAAVTAVGGGVYTINFTAGTALTGEALLDLHLHTPRKSYTGRLMRKTVSRWKLYLLNKLTGTMMSRSRRVSMEIWIRSMSQS